MPTKIQLRRGTAAQWEAVNPVLSAGEPGVESDTGRFLVGDGVTAWLDLVIPSAGEIADALAALTKASVGLGNVDNTSDAAKPVSSAMQAALDAKASTGALAAEASARGDADTALDGRLVTVASDQAEIAESIGAPDGIATLTDERDLDMWQASPALALQGGENFSHQEPGTLSASFLRCLGIASRRQRVVTGRMVSQSNVSPPYTATITLGGTVTGGGFVISVNGQLTSSITALSATGADVQAALEALSNVGDAGSQISVSGAAGGPWVISHVPDTSLIPFAISSSTLTGTNPTVTVTVNVWQMSLEVVRRKTPADSAALTDDFSNVAPDVALGAPYVKATTAALTMLGASGGGLKVNSTGAGGGLDRNYIRTDFKTVDVTYDVCATATVSTGQDILDLILKASDGRNAIACRMNIAGRQFTIYAYENAVLTNLGRFDVAAGDMPAGLGTYYGRVVITGNLITFNVYTSDPAIGSPTPLPFTGTNTATLVTTRAAAFGAGVEGYTGFSTLSIAPTTFRLRWLRTSSPRTIIPIKIMENLTRPPFNSINGENGEAVVKYRPWVMDNHPVALPDLDADDVLFWRGIKTGAPPDLVYPYFEALTR